ncbi:MAG: ABC transporter substrate-binding protein, partial [Culicoidibacterales bacterium]
MNQKNYLFIGIIILFTILALIFLSLPFIQPTKVVEPVTINFASWAESPLENMVIDYVIDSFTAETGILVERETLTNNYNEILTNQFCKKAAPDVFFVDSAMYQFWQERDWLLNVNDLIVDQSDYLPIMQSLFTTDDQFYSVPKDFANLVLFVNESLLNEAGYSIGDVPLTLDEFLPFLL